jgi:hypothetical protein
VRGGHGLEEEGGELGALEKVAMGEVEWSWRSSGVLETATGGGGARVIDGRQCIA